MTNLSEVGDQLDLQVELIARADHCRRCGRGAVTFKDRPVVAVRDLPIGGRATVLRRRKRRYACTNWPDVHRDAP